jgi:hypothetical protein
MTYLSVGYYSDSTPSITPRCIIDDIKYDAFNAVYTLNPIVIGNSISSWGTVNFANTLNDATIQYGFYTCASVSCTSTTFTSSQTITSGSIPTLATAPYATVSAAFSRVASTQTPALSSIEVNWYEGTITHTWGSVDKNHRIMWAVAEGTNTVPTATYIYDPRFQSWTKYSTPFDASVLSSGFNYFGGVSTGVVYKWPSGNNDAGNPINAFWKSKDFIGIDPYVEKDFNAVSLVAKAQTGSNLDFYYTIDTSSTVLRSISLTNSLGQSYIRNNQHLRSGTFGTFFNFQFGNSDADAPFEVYTVRFDYMPRNWRPLP